MGMIFYVYFLIVGVLAALLTRQHVKQFGITWKRRYILPLGFLLVVLLIVLLSFLIPPNIVAYFYSPIIAYYVGIIAHLSFRKIDEYDKNVPTRHVKK